MFHNSHSLNITQNSKGFGLITAIFVIVVLAMFGVLVARYMATDNVASAQDYLWTQAIYSAESAARLRFLNHDGGGNWVVFVFPTINQFTTQAPIDNFGGINNPSILSVRATRANISREVEIKFIL